MSVERPVEVELKYLVRDPAAADRLLTAPSIGHFEAGPPAEAVVHDDRYVDSADGALARAGYAARLRRTPSEILITIKSTATRPGALQHREELEAAADGSLDPHGWPESDARSLVLELCGDSPLVELVTIRQSRRRRELRLEDSLAELSLDEVDVVAGDHVVDRFVELEVELRGGDVRRLAELRDVLDLDEGLTAAAGSKLERALAAVGGAGGTGVVHEEPLEEPLPETILTPVSSELRDEIAAEAVAAGEAPASTAAMPEVGEAGTAAVPERLDVVAPPARTPGVLAEDAVAEAGRKVLRFHLARMIAREPGTRLGKDPEELHAMRVATRRMRAAWRVFGDGFRPDRTRRLRNRLRVVAGRLGAVRDQDVLIDALEGYQATLPPAERAGIEPLLEAWRSQREEARALLLRELDSTGYRRWLEDYREFARHDGMAVSPTSPTMPHRVRDTAASHLWLAYEHVRAYEAVLRWADVATLHELRIAAKRLRYTLEFIRETLGPEAGPLIARVVALQDHLGLLNDADVAATLARSFLVDRAGELTEAETHVIGRYLISREQEVARLKRTVGGAWRGVAGLGFRRALGRVTAGL